MRKLKYTISKIALNQMYMSYLLPVVVYTSVVWNGCSEEDSQTLQKIQNEAARLFTVFTRSVSLENLYEECRLTLDHKEGSEIYSLSSIMLVYWDGAFIHTRFNSFFS